MAFIRTQFMSQALTRAVSVSVILPSDAITGVPTPPPYKTLYLLPGYSNDSLNLVTYLGLRKQAELKGIAIVVPDGYNAFYVDHPDRAENYATFVGEELVRTMRTMFPLSEKREDTFIGGISMGGYGALYVGGRFRTTFSRVISLSPAADPRLLLSEEAGAVFAPGIFQNIFGDRDAFAKSEQNLEVLYGKTPAKELPAVFLTCGSEDIAVIESVRKFRDFMETTKVRFVYREKPGNHELEFWEDALDPAFSFLADIPEGTKNRLIMLTGIPGSE